MRYTTLLICLLIVASPTEADHARVPRDPGVELGRRIYQEGVLPDGSPLVGMRPEGLALHGAQAACINCHRRSGFGSSEGTILVAPVTGSVLFAPAPYYVGPHPRSGRAIVPRDRAQARPAYDPQSFARALREGVDPNGDPLTEPMPRYALEDRSVAALIAYLTKLSARPAPGIESATLHLATVVTPDAPPAARAAVLGVLEAWAAGQHFDTRWQLHVWALSGPPEGWEAQLQERYRKQPVFAVLSGAGGTEWRPVHRFCEDRGVPCVLPSVEVAPHDAEDHYSLYYSSGVTLEAQVLASALRSEMAAHAAPARIVQVSADAAGRRAAAVLRANLDSAAAPIAERRFARAVPAATLQDLSANDDLVLWLRPAELSELVALSPQGPPSRKVFLSALLAPPAEVSLPASWKARVRYVSLFDDSATRNHGAVVALAQWLERAGLPHTGDLRVQADAYGACYFFTAALARMQTQQRRWRKPMITRDYLLENLEQVVSKDDAVVVETNSSVPYYARMSLGPDQRVAVKGGALLRYASPDSQALVGAKEHIVP